MGQRWRTLAGWLVLIFVMTFSLGAGCAERSAATPSQVIAFDAQRAWRDLNQQITMGYRIPGTATHRAAKDWLVSQLTQTAEQVTLQPFTHTLDGKQITMWNVMAFFPGTGASPHQRVLLAAHWDSRPHADQDPDEAKRHMPVPGANDGASGTAILLEVARQLHDRPVSPDVVIVLFDGEDYGPDLAQMLLGSKYFAAHLPEKRPDWGILLDMVGDADLELYREPASQRHARAVNDRIFRAARELGYLKVGSAPGFVDALGSAEIIDDHTPLNTAGVPTADLIDFDYPAWHTVADSPKQCSPESLNIVGRTILLVLHSVK